MTGGRYAATATAGAPALSIMSLPARATGDTEVDLDANISLTSGGSGGIVFDDYGATDYKMSSSISSRQGRRGHTASRISG